MRVFVLSLKEAVDRREFMTTQLNKLNIPFEFFDAIRGTVEMYQLPEYNREAILFRTKKDLSFGELGCYFSHCELWKKCIELNEPICVLEDDVLLADGLLEILDKLINQVSLFSYGLVRLGSMFNRTHYIIQENGVDFKVHFKQNTQTIGYVIKPEAAQVLFDFARNNIADAIDATIDLEFKHKVNVYGIDPYLVFNNLEFDSMIDSAKKRDEKAKFTICHKIKLKFYKLRNNFNRMIYTNKRYLRDKYIDKKIVK